MLTGIGGDRLVLAWLDFDRDDFISCHSVNLKTFPYSNTHYLKRQHFFGSFLTSFSPQKGE